MVRRLAAAPLRMVLRYQGQGSVRHVVMVTEATQAVDRMVPVEKALFFIVWVAVEENTMIGMM